GRLHMHGAGRERQDQRAGAQGGAGGSSHLIPPVVLGRKNTLCRSWLAGTAGRKILAYTIACRGSGMPSGKAHGVPGPGGRAIARNVIDVAELEPELCHGPRKRQPVLDLRGAGLEMRFAEAAELVDVAAAQAVEKGGVELFVDDEMAEPARGDERHAEIAVPALDRVRQGFAEGITARDARLVGRVVG